MHHSNAMRLIGILLSLAAMAAAAPPYKELSRSELRDRIAGGWAGQMIGVSFGAPTEFKSNGKILEGDLPAWKPERVSNALNQDDLYVDMTFAKVLDDKGLDATTEDFGAMFRGRQVRLVARQPGRAAQPHAAAFRPRSPARRSTTPTPTTSTSRSKPTSSG